MSDDDKNSRPFSHLCKRGIIVKAQRCDLRGGVDVIAGTDATEVHIAEAVAQAMGYHAGIIRPELNGFAGYDTIDILIARR